MAAPARFAGLAQFADKAWHGPSVAKLARRHGTVVGLCVALSHLDNLHTQRLRQVGPAARWEGQVLIVRELLYGLL